MDLDMFVKILMPLLGVMAAYAGWMMRSTAQKISKISVDVAVIKETISAVKPDHDKLVLLDARVEKHSEDLRNTNDRIRRSLNGRPS